MRSSDEPSTVQDPETDAGPPPAADAAVAEFAGAASVLGCEMADIAGTLEDSMALARSQASRFAAVGAGVAAMVQANESIRDDATATLDAARGARERVEQALSGAVGTIESGLASVSSSLAGALGATQEIERIALQTRMVALNASVQAAHAGDDGHSFAVVAGSVRDLAERIQSSSKTIVATLAGLTGSINALANRGETATDASLRAAIDAAVERFQSEFGAIERRIGALGERAAHNLGECGQVDGSVRSMATEVEGFSHAIELAARKSDNLLGMSERLIEITTRAGTQTDDTPFIETAVAVADELGSRLEAALEANDVTWEELFDEHYRPVPGTDPEQVLTRFVPLTDRLFPPVQESVLEWSERVTFCAAVDRNGYLPTHNAKYSQPQGPDPSWNAAHCRNRRVFRDRTGSAAGRNQKPFLVQTYRRDMGGGAFAILKEVDAPIRVRGRHWGNVRIGYRPFDG